MPDHNIITPPVVEAPADIQSAYRLAGIPSVSRTIVLAPTGEDISLMNLTELCDHAAETEVNYLVGYSQLPRPP